MNTNISVSVIVPVYNVEKFLKRCLDSLINQTLQNIEIICINDGSTDKSVEILEEYRKKDSRIIVINQKNQGLSVTRNNGIDIAKGEFISFVDSDDWIDFEFLEKLYNAAVKYGCDVACSGIIRLHKMHKKKHLQHSQTRVTENFSEKLELCDVPDKSYVWNKIYKTSELKKHNLKFEPGMIYEDVMFTPQVLYLLRKLVTVPDVYYYYWRNTNSLVTQRNAQAIADREKANKWAREFLKKHNVDIESYSEKSKKYKIFNITIFQVRRKRNKTQYSLFNIIKMTITKDRK